MGLSTEECGLGSSSQVHTHPHAGDVCAHCRGPSCTGAGLCVYLLLKAPTQALDWGEVSEALTSAQNVREPLKSQSSR